MGVLKDKFADLKNAIVGTTTVDIDQKLDMAVKDITSYRANQNRNSYVELIKSLIAKNGSFDIPSGSGGLFGQSISPMSFGQGNRIARYRMYEAIVSHINYCSRALSVLTDNILSPDDITKISLEIIPTNFLEDEVPTESKSKYIEEIISLLKLEDMLPMIVKNTLEYGDFFCEIGDEKTALTNRSIVSENDDYGYNNYIADQFESGIKENIVLEDNNQKYRFIIDYSSFVESNNKTSSKERDVNSIKLMFHEPNFVVKLQSSMFPVCFGYLVFPQMAINPQMSMQDDTLNTICKSILKSVSEKVPQIDAEVDKKDLMDLLSHLVSHMDPSKAMNIRFVSTDKMIHFKMNSTKYYPYGESIFDNCQFTAKVLIVLETALAIQRISRSTEKRKIMVEVGLPRDAKKAIEKLKEEFRKRKVSLDSFGSVDTIPCLDLNTEIKMSSGCSLTIEEIIKQYENGNKDMYVYSYNPENGQIFPNKIVNASVSGRNVKVLKITLDNNRVVKCTPEHRWLMRDGTYKEAKDLKAKDSLMPFYRRNTKLTNNSFVTYEQILHPGTNNKSGKWELTHRAFSRYWGLINESRNICHHFDKNPRNNHKKNLLGVNHEEHMQYHLPEAIDSRKNCGGTGEILVKSICKYCKEEYEHPYNMYKTCGKDDCVKAAKIEGGKNSWEAKKHQAKYDKITVSCDWCGDDIEIGRGVYENKRKRNAGVLCNKYNCNILYRNWIRRFKNNKHFCKVEFINCENCGIPITWGEEKKKLKVCSNVCSQSVLSKRRWKNNNIKVKCDWCEDDIIIKKSDLKKRYFSCEKENCKTNIHKFSKSISLLKKTICDIYYTTCKYCVKLITASEDSVFIERHVARSKGYCNLACSNGSRSKAFINHKVKSIEIEEKLIDVGDIEVEKFSNFGLDAGVFIHNSHISTFEDIYIPQKDGKPYVDIQTFNEGNVDTRSKVEELKFLRDQLISSLNIPPSFLSIEENLSNKNALSEENIMFARTIVSHQKNFKPYITELIKKVLDIVNPEEALTILDNLDINLPTPKSLQFEREAKYMSDLSNLVETLERIGVPKEYSSKKYLTMIDWAEVDKYKINNDIEKNLDPEKKKEDEAGAMMGGGMGY